MESRCKSHLQAEYLEHAIIKDGFPTAQEQAQTLVYLKHHIHEDLKSEYILIDDPKELWDNLTKRFEHLQRKIAPRAAHEWATIRFQDFATVREYNSIVLRITEQLKLCGQPVLEKAMIEKTLSTMHAQNMKQSEQYRERSCTNFFDLISVLLVAEQYNHILLDNHNKRPTGTNATPEANAIDTNISNHPLMQLGVANTGIMVVDEEIIITGKGRGKGKGRALIKGAKISCKTSMPLEEGERANNYRTRTAEKCFKCGIAGRWSKRCRTAKHLVDLYMASQKAHGKHAHETNFAQTTSPTLDLNVTDYLADDVADIRGTSS